MRVVGNLFILHKPYFNVLMKISQSVQNERFKRSVDNWMISNLSKIGYPQQKEAIFCWVFYKIVMLDYHLEKQEWCIWFFDILESSLPGRVMLSQGVTISHRSLNKCVFVQRQGRWWSYSWSTSQKHGVGRQVNRVRCKIKVHSWVSCC